MMKMMRTKVMPITRMMANIKIKIVTRIKRRMTVNLKAMMIVIVVSRMIVTMKKKKMMMMVVG